MTQTRLQPESTSIILQVINLLRLRWMIFAISFRRASLARKLVYVLIALLLVGLVGFFLYVSWYLLSLLKSPTFSAASGNTGSIIDSVPNLLISGTFIGILLTSFGVLLQALYLAGDMGFLLSRPVPIRAVFIAKLLQAVLPNLVLVSAFALPILFGLGMAEGYHPLFYPLVLIELVVISLAAAGISSLLVMGIVRIFPARRVAEVIGFIGVILWFLCSQSGQLANWAEFSSGDLNQALAVIQRFDTPLSPLYWAGQGLVSIGSREWLHGAGLVLLTLLAAAAIFSLSLVTAENLYYSGWANMQVRAGKAKRARRERHRGDFPGISLAGRFVSPATWAIVAKDWTVIRRDLRNMSQLITPLIVGIIYAVMLLRSGGQVDPGRGEAPEWFMELMQNFMAYANIGISLFVGWMLLTRLAGMAFSQEGKNYWLLKSSPVNTTELIAGKYLASFIPVLALGWGFLAIIMLIQRASPGMLLYSATVVAFCIAGNTGINLALGIIDARMDWEDPRQMQRGSIGCLGSLASMIYLGTCLALFFGTPILTGMLGTPLALGQTIGLLLGIPFSLACAVVPLWLIRPRVSNLGEPAG